LEKNSKFNYPEWLRGSASKKIGKHGDWNPDFQMDYQTALKILNRLCNEIEGETGKIPFHKNQIATAIEAISSLYSQKQFSRVCIAASMQAGKTGVIHASILLIEEMFKMRGQKKKDCIALNLPADKEMGRQLMNRLGTNIPIGRGAIAGVAEKVRKYQQKYYDAVDEGKEEEFMTRVRWRWKTDGWMSAPMIPKNSVLFLDENHHASGKDSQMNKILDGAGIYLGKPKHTWKLPNTKVIFTSATPMTINAATEKDEDVTNVILQPGSEYYGLSEMKQDGKIKQNFPLTNRKEFDQLFQIMKLEGSFNKDNPGFSLVRCSRTTHWTKEEILKRLKKSGLRVKDGIPTKQDASNYDAALVILDQNTNRKEEYGEFFTAPTHFDSDGYWFGKQPAIPCIVVMKNLLKMGATLKNEFIHLIFDKKSKAKKQTSDVVVQAGVGRACGYEAAKNCPVVYTDIPTVNEYLKYVDSGFSVKETPKKTTRMNSKPIKEYDIAASLPVSIKNLKKRDTLIDEIISRCPDIAVANKLAASSIRVLTLWNWGVSSKQVMDKMLAQIKAGVPLTTVDGHFQGHEAVIILENRNNPKVHLVFASDGKDNRLVTAKNSMYLAAK